MSFFNAREIGKWYSKKIGALLTDLSKASECLSNDPSTVKSYAYGFSIDSLRLEQAYLSNHKQRTRINSAYSSWEEILYKVPQGSILGPLLLNIFLCDLFFIMDDIDFPSYADYNTWHTIGNDIEDIIFKLQNLSKTLFQWFMDNNQIKVNPYKCHFICSTNDTVNLIVEYQIIGKSKCKELLGVKFNYKFTFNAQIDDIWKKSRAQVKCLIKTSTIHEF